MARVLTRSQHDLVAKAIRNSIVKHRYKVAMAQQIATAFQENNVMFDRARFMHIATDMLGVPRE